MICPDCEQLRHPDRPCHYKMSDAERQEYYVRAYQNIEVPCPACNHWVNINAVRDNEDNCPECKTALHYCLGMSGNQWLERKEQ